MTASCATPRWLHFQGTRGWLRSPDASHVAGRPGGRDRRLPGRVGRGPTRRRRDDVGDRAGGRDRRPHRGGRGHRHRHADRAPRLRARATCDALARQALPGAASRVFTTPPRQRPRARAGRAQRAGAAGQPQAMGQGVSRQARALGPRILALDAVLAAPARAPRRRGAPRALVRRARRARAGPEEVPGRGRAAPDGPRRVDPRGARAGRAAAARRARRRRARRPCGPVVGGPLARRARRARYRPTPREPRASSCSAQAGVPPGSRCRLAATRE